MKNILCAMLIIFFASIVGCKTFGIRHLDKQKVVGAKTALVIDTEFFPSHNVPHNGFNLKCEDMSKDECNEVIMRLRAAEAAHRQKLMAYLAGLTRAALTAKGMPEVGLDRKVFHDSKQFPLSYKGDMMTYCAVSRDYRELMKKGYTHIIYVGFPNRIRYKKDQASVMFFGIEAFMVDLRPEMGDMESRDNRCDRLVWCYNISPSLVGSSTSSSYDLYTYRNTGTYKTTYTTTTTTYHRNCLGIALQRRNGINYTLDELFSGPAPLYLDVYKRAALYGLSFAGQHLVGKDIPRGKVKAGVAIDDFITKVKLP
ncbi:MAG TPA: hypothetical protein ENN21_10555 [Spirochaetes bacterium]|nr:hypothetical protein [Spirochaetota bacterium]